MITHFFIESLQIPFRVSFKHHSATRTTTETILVKLEGPNWNGWGESCPRRYVTGESCESATTQINTWLKNGIPFFDLPSWDSFCDAHKDSIEKNPAAFCALELAFFDGYSKYLNIPVSSILGWQKIEKTFHYSAVLGDGSFSTFQKLAEAHLNWGFKSFKIKISGNPEIDFEKLIWLFDQNSSLKIRLDANNCFSSANQAIQYLQHLPIPIEAMEEPLESKSNQELLTLIQSISTPIILDEMAIRKDDLLPFSNFNQKIWINLRVSKMGGIQKTNKILKLAEELGFGIVVGCQVGETSLLAHAGLLIAQQVSNLKGLEGGYSDRLLEYDPFKPPIIFGENGSFNGVEIGNTPGFGVRLGN
jgi:L-alanine-DL-glutamate epimerase-like enolase superfamily enzyme